MRDPARVPKEFAEKVINSRDNCSKVWFVLRRDFRCGAAGTRCVWGRAKPAAVRGGGFSPPLPKLDLDSHQLGNSLFPANESVERRMVMREEMSASVLLGGKNPHQQALLDCNLTDKSTDCKLVWLLVNFKAASPVIPDWEWEHGTKDLDKNRCRLFGPQDGGHRGKNLATLVSLRPHSSLAPVFSWENCPSTGLTGGEAVPVSVSQRPESFPLSPPPDTHGRQTDGLTVVTGFLLGDQNQLLSFSPLPTPTHKIGYFPVFPLVEAEIGPIASTRHP